MAPKIRDFSLTATERTAVAAIVQAERLVVQRLEALGAEKMAIAAEIETRLCLPAGALGDNPTHRVNLDDFKVEPIPPKETTE